MAEALMRLHYGNEFDVYSAGTEATFVKKPAIAVMEELGVDMSQHYSKTIEDLGDLKMDYVVTVCDDAREQCPFHPGKRETIHHSFPDPSGKGEQFEEQVDAFRITRDQISKWLNARFGK
jgi:arsenate reductase